MRTGHIIDTVESATNVFAWVAACVAAFIGLGIAFAPFVSLPARVEANEESIRSINSRLDNSDKKLDVLICFHRAESEGSDPSSCSLR